jgi:hypothetical protein
VSGDDSTPVATDPATGGTDAPGLGARLASRKFILAMLVQGTASVALFTGRIDGGTYVAVSSLSLSIYGASSVADKKLNPGAQ